MTITFESDDASVPNRETLANTIRVALVYIFDRLRNGVEQAHPDRHNDTWYSLFMEDVSRARCLRHLLEAIDLAAKKEE